VKSLNKYFWVTLVVSILAGIILPIALGVKDPVYIAISFSSVWAIYSLILFGYVFLVEGRRNRNRPKIREEEDPFPPKLFQEWEALWEKTIKKNDQDKKKILWS